MYSFLDFIAEYWRRIILSCGIAVGTYLLLFYKLHSLIPLYSHGEVLTQQTTQYLHVIWNNPDYAPYKLVLWALHTLGHHAILDARILSGLFGIITGGLFFYIVRAWFSVRIASVSTILFVTSSSFLHLARYGTPLIMQMSVLVIFAIVLFYQTGREDLLGWRRAATRYILAILLLTSLYVPGTIWLLLLGAILLYRPLYHKIREQSVLSLLFLSLLSLIMLAPLFWIGYHNNDFALKILGLPVAFPTLSVFWHNLFGLLLELGWKSNIQPEIALVGAPLLGVISLALVFLGIAAQLQRPRLHTNYYLILSVPLTIILVSIGGPVTYVMLAPLLYLLMAGGLYYLLDQWLQVFPKNMIARFVGVTFISILMLFSVFYQLRSYYVAWPHATPTKAVYNLPHPK